MRVPERSAYERTVDEQRAGTGTTDGDDEAGADTGADAGGPTAAAQAGGGAGRAADDAAEDKRREGRFELVATVLLAVAALATAWSGYQASLWDGIQSSDYSQASALRVEANRRFTEANQFRLADLSLFENYVDATLSGETEIADFYRARFRDEFIPAFEAWEATDPSDPVAPDSPFAMDEYVLSAEVEGRDLEDQAHAMFEHGEEANSDSDTYVLTTLFFASALFFAAISERFSVTYLRTTLLVISALGLVVGLAITVTMPITGG